jgi:hypothetical protein
VHCENDKPIANMERNLRVKAFRALPRHRDAPIPNIDAVEDRLSGPANAVVRILLCECCRAKAACRLQRKSRDSASEKGEMRCEGAVRSCGTADTCRWWRCPPRPLKGSHLRNSPSQFSRLSAKERPTTVELIYPSSTRPCE